VKLPETPVASRIEAGIRRVGDALSWLWLVLLFVVLVNVALRHLFGGGRIELEELQWHLYAVGFLCALSYCVESDVHIRVDALRGRFSPRLQAWIELYGILLLLLPFTALVIFFSVPFAADSFARGEVSPSPGGLPLRGLVKSALPVGFGLLALAAVARGLRALRLLFGKD
jgi:TRAP-type mannitol/chloroaromatic compound transport system permease small subunit